MNALLRKMTRLNGQNGLLGGRARINFRPLLFCALGLAFGIFLYARIRFGGFRPSDLLFVLLFCFFSLRPASVRRAAAVFLCVALCACVGAGCMHLYTRDYLSAETRADCTLSGTVVSFTPENGYTVAVLSNIALNGEPVGGKCRITLGGEVRPSDAIVAKANVNAASLEDFAHNSYTQYLFANGIRYTANASQYEKTGKSKNVFLRLNAAVYDVTYAHMSRDEAGVAYALLTGNSGGMDDGLLNAVRQGGIAHVFAVSGLHIGILFSFAYFCFRPLGKYRFIPAFALALGYSAMCGFTVSSVRAVIMCGVFGALRACGRKYDFLQSISFAAILVLVFAPSQWFAAGFRLSFGACLGLALFAGSFSRFFAHMRIPKAIGGYLAANLSVQLFTFPVFMQTFGYLSVWGFLLNLVIVPFVPVLFLGLLFFTALALIVPPAAVLLAVPSGMLSLLIFLFASVDFSLVITGFSLGVGATVWLVGCVALSPRMRLEKLPRGVAAVGLSLLFCACVMLQNVVFTGCRIAVYEQNGYAALVQTKRNSVLVIDGEISLSSCERFLMRTYGGKLDAVVVLAEDETAAINVAAFIGAGEIVARKETETGLRVTQVTFGETFACGGLLFRYEGADKLSLTAEGVTVEFDFYDIAALSADLFIGDGSGGLNFYLKNGIIGEK